MNAMRWFYGSSFHSHTMEAPMSDTLLDKLLRQYREAVRHSATMETLRSASAADFANALAVERAARAAIEAHVAAIADKAR